MRWSYKRGKSIVELLVPSRLLLALPLLLLHGLLLASDDVRRSNIRLVVEMPLDVKAHVRLRVEAGTERRVRNPVRNEKRASTRARA